MMSAVVQGFNKPKNCHVCPFNRWDCYCNLTKGKIDRDDWTCSVRCPIEELPEGHGRLIDADAFIKTMEDAPRRYRYKEPLLDNWLTVDDVFKTVIASLQNENEAPTIIGADKAE